MIFMTSLINGPIFLSRVFRNGARITPQYRPLCCILYLSEYKESVPVGLNKLNRNFCDQKTQKPNKKEELGSSIQELKKKVLEGGVTITDLQVGAGALAKSGKTVSVYYSGKLKSSNKVFDELTEGFGLRFRLGRGDVIAGWDVGVIGMKVGGKRIITCPPKMAYGAKGYPPVIPPNSTLVFEVQLKDVE